MIFDTEEELARFTITVMVVIIIIVITVVVFIVILVIIIDQVIIKDVFQVPTGRLLPCRAG